MQGCNFILIDMFWDGIRAQYIVLLLDCSLKNRMDTRGKWDAVFGSCSINIDFDFEQCVGWGEIITNDFETLDEGQQIR